MTTIALVEPRCATRRSPMGRYKPVQFGPQSRWKFIRERRAEAIRQAGGELDEQLLELAEMKIEAEWGWLELSAQARRAADQAQRIQLTKFATDQQRIFLLASRDFNAALKAKRKAEASNQSRPPNLDEYLAKVAAERANAP